MGLDFSNVSTDIHTSNWNLKHDSYEGDLQTRLRLVL